MTDSTNLKADFRDWLTLPLTKIFVEILTNERDRHLEYGNQASFQSYYKKELSEQATLAYGKADGISTILDLMETCKDEEPVIRNLNLEGKDIPEITTYPTIDELFQQTFEPDND